MALAIPSLILKRLHTYGSLTNTDEGVQFSVKNRLSDAVLTGISKVKIDGKEIPLESVRLFLDDGSRLSPYDLTQSPLDFPLRRSLKVNCEIEPLTLGIHKIEIHFDSKPFGKLKLKAEDAIAEEVQDQAKIPRSSTDDYNDDIIKKRQQYVEEFSGAKLDHVAKYSFDPKLVKGNIENFSGVAQIPIGFAGPVKIKGEHAQGDFLIPLATTEGTLIASYNRGIKVLNLSGGVTSSVVGDAMQRAPVFVFENAREARNFIGWVDENIEKIRTEAEATSRIAKLEYIDPYLASKFAYLRFNFTTGDAAGQNMVGRATFAACSWIVDEYPGIRHFYLESNLATDKKASQVNIMRTRGKRVTAEAVVDRDILIQQMRVKPEALSYHANVSNVGTILSGANNNGAHSANGITAIFMATGQDVANVSESSAGILYTEITPEGHLYLSITIPSLIVATYGGGTGLATQQECLRVMGCAGAGKVNKFAEIIAGVVLAGELSLGSAISSLDWVSSHERYGRNR
ncbi:MAG: hydroxymethylglutaryl-CoA reductase [Anaerolineae bacterium]|nr:MAG: hydroxymethylglutaryl-CoA reductase [Anaerolineae bacterium]